MKKCLLGWIGSEQMLLVLPDQTTEYIGLEREGSWVNECQLGWAEVVEASLVIASSPRTT